MTGFICWLIAVFIRPIQLGLGYEVLNHFFPALPHLEWLQVYACFIVVRMAYYSYKKEDEGNMKERCINILAVNVVATAFTAIIWAIVL